MSVVVATSSAHLTPTVFVAAGQLWDADDPIVKANPGFFSDDLDRYAVRTVAPVIEETTAEPVIEETTAEPGAKRNTGARASTK